MLYFVIFIWNIIYSTYKKPETRNKSRSYFARTFKKERSVLKKLFVTFHVLAQFLFNASETELGYCRQKVNVYFS